MNKIKLLLGASMFASTLIIAPVMALSGSGSTPASEPAETEHVDTPKDLSDRKTRLDDNKTRLKTKISELDKKRITAKCKPSQALVGTAGKSTSAIAANRAKAFDKISARVQTLIDRFKADGKDTALLEADLKVAQTKALTLSADFKLFDQSLIDLRLMDCVADPLAFQAALDTARAQLETTKTAAADLRTYISSTLKPAIEQLKTGLEASETTNEKSEAKTTVPVPDAPTAPPTTTTTKTTGGTN